jgi:diguanylate cyclase (GGDEF)-like protein
MTMLLLPAALLFMGLQYLMLQILVCLDQRVPWSMSGLFQTDGIISDVMMTLLGALIGRLYRLDPSTILLTIVPLATLQRTLQRMQQAKLAHIDAKTELYNYRHLDRALSEEVRKATQSGRPLTLIFGDMDYLRDINNTYGHLAGDRALKAVASIFKRCARPSDVAARFGGEEFVLLMPGIEKEQAGDVAERIRRETAAARLETDDGGVFSVTISLGVASFPGDATTVQGLIKAADEAVYAAKHAGKNQVCAYPTGVAI